MQNNNCSSIFVVLVVLVLFVSVLPALFIEAEYGDTIEVYQEKIALEKGQEPLVDIFRLGRRVSVFFLTLDNARCGVYSPSKNQWQTLDPEYLSAIRSAVDVGKKLRPATLLLLPLGRLNPEEFGKNGAASTHSTVSA